ncbi:MAG: T9SS type A sorting domain-containing protein [Bacteroidetes bacterium]|jgi:chitinase|nr:T9SS type A sorting domain-containing protein [Bacteroidota bacterium]MBT6687052.1 T9SS type A sorting domain-containing protein [Bacteroidota bacterium]MBT7144116.1 T9SS type A sorting domain-containing protein [Bacteroidota bacterium]MBT7492571.1 T9SS type A sorting domain-containing protein [Bacteroidota bacterium]
MKNSKLILQIVIFVFLLNTNLKAQPCKEVIGYYPNWQWYDRANLVEPSAIDYSKYSILNYAFFNANLNGSISETDSWADENLLFGQHDWVNGGYLPNTSLIDIAHTNNVKVMVSIGGWTLSNNFPAIAANPNKRTIFASECVRLLQDYNFDGIDIDWEYPGYAPHNGTPADGVNYTLLLQEIRDSIDAYGLQNGNDYLLSSCFSADPAKMQIIEWNNLIGILDMFNLMTYDFFGAFSTLSNHNSPLYAPAAGDTSFNIHSAFTNITQTYGLPASKLNIGVPFYGRSVTTCTGLHQTHSGSADNSTFWEDDGSPLYYNVLNKMNLFSSFWDSQAQVPYLLGNSINTFVSYDDEQSIAMKAQYVVDNNARGVIIWEITGDYIETSSGSGTIAGTPLADTLNYVLCGLNVNSEQHSFNENEVDFAIYPNPAKNNIFIKKDNFTEVKISDIFGREIIATKNSTINISKLSSGIYFVSLKNTKENIHRIEKLVVE